MRTCYRSRLLSLFLPLFFTAFLCRAQNSVLSSGRWIKVGITQSGLYKIDAAWLAKFQAKSTQIGIYGQEIGELPTLNSVARPTDLQPIPFIKQGDSWVFYGEKFPHSYSDSSFYFIRLDDPAPKAITEIPATSSSTGPALDYGLSRFHYEPETYNLLQSGREWLGDGFFGTTTRNIQYPLADYKTGLSSSLSGRLASSSIAPGTFSFSIPGNTVNPLIFPSTTGGRYDQKAFLQSFSARVYPEIKDQNWSWNLTYTNTTGSGYLDFLDLEYPRKFNALHENPRYTLPNTSDSTFRISLQNFQSNHQIWLKTPGETWKALIKPSASLLFTNLKPRSELLLFDPLKAAEPTYLGSVTNQNLRGQLPVTFLVISSPTILPAATLLAAYKSAKGMVSRAVSTQEIYHEFSAGKQDVTAIRDFIRLKKPAYVLLLGDATVDYKGNNKVATATERMNYVPSYESRESFQPLQTYVSDDYFGLLEAQQGEWLEGDLATNESISVGIGRIPARSLAEANRMVNKLISYETKSRKQPYRFGWLADDGDANIHVQDAEDFSTLIPAAFQVQKTYLDQFPQELANGFYTSEAGRKASLALFNQDADFIHFLGHGSESAWTDEKVITNNELQNLKNSQHLPILLTATCQFGRFDDPNQLSGAEISLLSNQGGAIALLSTTRPVFQSSNYLFGQAFYKQVARHLNDSNYRLGDLFRDAKNDSQSGVINRNISLLGDPTLPLPWSHTALQIKLDTLASGLIQATTNPAINGEIQLFYYGEEKPRQTLGTKTPKYNYLQGGELEASSRHSVKAGKFTFSPIPASKLNWLSTTDASFFAGGMTTVRRSNLVSKEVDAPILEARLLNELNPQQCSPNPILQLKIKDASALRFVGPTGEVALLTINDTLSIPLASLFLPDLNSSNQGTLTLPFESLTAGKYTVKATIFDLHTNQGNLTFSFQVSSEKVGNGSLRIYPNPLSEKTTFSFLQEKRWTSYVYKLKIYSILGNALLEKTGVVPGSDSDMQSFVIDWTTSEKGQLDFLNFYQLDIVYDTGAPFASFQGRIALIK
jgi:hypothetical protein